jgi:hypothetical protein
MDRDLIDGGGLELTLDTVEEVLLKSAWCGQYSRGISMTDHQPPE